MKLLSCLLLLALLHAAYAQKCAEPRKTVTLTSTDATMGTSFPTQNINRGDTVVWTNQRSTPFVIISTDSPKRFESPQLANGNSYSFTFEEAGTFGYWMLFELNTFSEIRVTPCEPFTITASPTPTQVVSFSSTPTVTPPVTPSPSPSFTPSRSGGRLPPSATPSPVDFCTGKPTNEIDLTSGSGVLVYDNVTLAVNAIRSQAFNPLQTEDVRVTVTATGAIDFSVSAVQAEPFTNPICQWSTTNCVYSTQTFTLRCRTNYVATVNDALPPRVTWYANIRNRVNRPVNVLAQYLNVLREQKNPVVTTINMENFAGSEAVTLTA